MSLFALIAKPLGLLLIGGPMVAGSITSFGRIQNYMNIKEREDKRLAAQNPQSDVEKKGPAISPVVSAMPESNEYEMDEMKGKRPVSTHNDRAIVSVQGKLTWPEATEPVIDITEWNLIRRTFTLLLGPVGSGKSTLLKVILGEMTGFEGSIKTSFSGVGLCEQAPWMPNLSIRQIILGPAAFDQTWYHKVVEACALETDMEQWPHGDASIIGSKGISLSGGQKQRLVRCTILIHIGGIAEKLS